MVDLLFEVSSEAGNKVGGIYTVLQSKSSEMVKAFGKSYHLIGFYDESSAKTELEPLKMPSNIAKACAELKKFKIHCHYGKWTHGSNAKLILIDAREFMDDMVDGKKRVDTVKTELWDKYKIDSLMMPWDFNLNVGWSHAAGMFIEKLAKGKKVIAHFHEWISGAGLLYLKHKQSKVKTVFTTHATTLGRTKSAWEGNLMKEVSTGLKHGRKVNVQEAFKYKVEGKHLMEQVCAEQADVFTTVSKVVGMEAHYILGVKPSIITPNGLDFSRFGDMKTTIKNQIMRRKDVENFLYSFFLPYYDVDCKDSLLTFISGRYEFENKGIDVFIEALGKLNKTVKKPVFAFIFVPAGVRGIRKEITKNLSAIDKIFDNVKQVVHNRQDEVIYSGDKAVEKAKMFEEVIRDEEAKIVRSIADGSIKNHRWKDEGLITEAVNLFKGLKQDGDAPLSAFEMHNHSDSILDSLKDNGLLNRKRDKVKVVFYPTYIKPGDGLLNMPYYSVVNAMDVGVFPSRYEPWGYTPVESAALMNVAVASDLSGYGQFLVENFGDMSKRGIKVLKMENQSNKTIVNQLHKIFSDVASLNRDQLLTLKKDARKVGEKDNWKDLIKYYKQTYKMAVKK
jgi:glycogen(starch) synthase